MITFSYPAYNPTTSISFPSPEKGDQGSLNLELFLHPTESGQYKSNKKSTCFGEHERNLSFSSLCESEVNTFLDFITNSNGNYILYTDYNDVSWITQITSEVINISRSPAGYNIDMTLLVWEMT